MLVEHEAHMTIKTSYDVCASWWLAHTYHERQVGPANAGRVRRLDVRSGDGTAR
jgi:hypothetical protein